MAAAHATVTKKTLIFSPIALNESAQSALRIFVNNYYEYSIGLCAPDIQARDALMLKQTPLSNGFIAGPRLHPREPEFIFVTLGVKNPPLGIARYAKDFITTKITQI